MCGLAGILNFNREPIQPEILKDMTATIRHRGPDGEGIYVDGFVGLGHRRLAILDPSEKGAQPMCSKDGRWIISFNGCIYNFKELRRELLAAGHSFVSDSDTEVIAEGLAAFGPDYFTRFNGMFAVAAWDTRGGALYLSRDRYGIKPLYYWLSPHRIVFSSEIKAILKHPGYPGGLNYEALNEYFTFQNLFSFNTLFKDVILLPPANTVKITPDNPVVRHQSWWDYDFSTPDESLSFDEAKEETKRLFTQAVERQLVSDVPLGCFLSGGMDSGSITAIAARQIPKLPTFTCGFDMSEVTGREANFDERRDAELIANHFKTEQYEQIINAGDLAFSLDTVVGHIEDLKLGMSYPNYYISRLASKFVKVALQGTGGDELFGGYPWRYYHAMEAVGQEGFFCKYYDYWQRLVPDTEKQDLFRADVLARVDQEEPKRIFERVFLFNPKLRYECPEDHVQNCLYFEIKTFLPGLLLIGDKLSMASGLEERFPFLDNDLVDFAQKIPVRYKLGRLTETIEKMDENTTQKKDRYREFDDGKNVLRKAMADFIPPAILNRKKQGFSAPDESWYRGENAQFIKDYLLHSDNASHDFINYSYIKKTIDEHMAGKVNHRLLLWSLMNFESLLKTYTSLM